MHFYFSASQQLQSSINANKMLIYNKIHLFTFLYEHVLETL